MPKGKTPADSLAGQLLVAMPQMADARFERSVIYLCAHSAEGALGLVINRPFRKLSFADLLEQLEIERGPDARPISVGSGIVRTLHQLIGTAILASAVVIVLRVFRRTADSLAPVPAKA